MNITDLSRMANDHAVKKGFYTDDTGDCRSPIELIHDKLTEEVEELFKAYAHGRYMTDGVMEELQGGEIGGKAFAEVFEAKIKNTIGDELADIIITAAAGARQLGIDIERQVLTKMVYNRVRGDHDGV